MKALIVLLCCFFASSQAQIPFFGSCPNVTVVQDFNSSQILGKWYEAERYFSVLQILSKCISVEFGKNDNETFYITNRQTDFLTQTESASNMTATLPKNDTGKFVIHIPLLPMDVGISYEVLDTDYTTYAVVYSCMDIIGYNTKMLWVLTRNRFPTEIILKNAHRSIEDNKLDVSLLSKTEQWQCPIFH